MISSSISELDLKRALAFNEFDYARLCSALKGYAHVRLKIQRLKVGYLKISDSILMNLPNSIKLN